MVRQPVANVNSYSSDYKDIGIVKSISDKYGITIIAVQHLRKKYDSDPHQMISGSSGLIGAADGSYVLQKKKVGDDTAKLWVHIFTALSCGKQRIWLVADLPMQYTGRSPNPLYWQRRKPKLKTEK